MIQKTYCVVCGVVEGEHGPAEPTVCSHLRCGELYEMAQVGITAPIATALLDRAIVRATELANCQGEQECDEVLEAYRRARQRAIFAIHELRGGKDVVL